MPLCFPAQFYCLALSQFGLVALRCVASRCGCAVRYLHRYRHTTTLFLVGASLVHHSPSISPFHLGAHLGVHHSGQSINQPNQTKPNRYVHDITLHYIALHYTLCMSMNQEKEPYPLPNASQPFASAASTRMRYQMDAQQPSQQPANGRYVRLAEQQDIHT